MIQTGTAIIGLNPRRVPNGRRTRPLRVFYDRGSREWGWACRLPHEHPEYVGYGDGLQSQERAITIALHHYGRHHHDTSGRESDQTEEGE